MSSFLGWGKSGNMFNVKPFELRQWQCNKLVSCVSQLLALQLLLTALILPSTSLFAYGLQPEECNFCEQRHN